MKKFLTLLTLCFSILSFASNDYSSDPDIDINTKSLDHNNALYISEISSLSNSVEACNTSLHEYVDELNSKGAIIGKVHNCESISDVDCRVYSGHSCAEPFEVITVKGSVSFIYNLDEN